MPRARKKPLFFLIIVPMQLIAKIMTNTEKTRKLRFPEPIYSTNWENTEYASKGKEGQPEEKLPQGVVIILFMIATQAPECRIFWQFNFL